jgi:hypothetical protein
VEVIEDESMKLATTLQGQFRKEQRTERAQRAVRKQREEEELLGGIDGMALVFVQRVLGLAREHGGEQVEALARDDLVFFAQAMLQCREQWLAQWPRPPTNATVAYHYTSAQAIPTIRQVGLLSQKERQQNNAVTNKAFNGAVYGDGKALVPQL